MQTDITDIMILFGYLTLGHVLPVIFVDIYF